MKKEGFITDGARCPLLPLVQHLSRGAGVGGRAVGRRLLALLQLGQLVGHLQLDGQHAPVLAERICSK